MQSHFNWAFILGIYTALPRASVFCPTPPPHAALSQHGFVNAPLLCLQFTVVQLLLLLMLFDILCHISFSQIMMLKMKIIGTHWWNLIRWEKLNLCTVTASHAPPRCTHNLPAVLEATITHPLLGANEQTERRENENEKQQQKSENIFVVSHQISN